VEDAVTPRVAKSSIKVKVTEEESSVYPELLERLYDLDRTELRRLAYEALLISDGPDKAEGLSEAVGDSVHVVADSRSPSFFTIYQIV
jgi:hypothetical protein